MIDRTRRVLETVSVYVALTGGILLSAAAVFAVGAIVADAAGAPILGDTEVMEFAAAAAVASFLPLAQLRGAHVKITVFTDGLPEPVLRAIDTFARAAFAIVATVLAWRFAVGGIDAFARERITMFLQLPLWIGYLLAAVPMVLWVVVSWFAVIEALAGKVPRSAHAGGAPL